MEIFINELSLHEQYLTQESFTTAVEEFMRIFSVINDKIRSKELFKNELFITYQALQNETFQQSFEKIRNVQLKENFKRVIFNRLNPKNWQIEQFHSGDILYSAEKCTYQDKYVTLTSVAEVAERVLQKPDLKHILINFKDSQFKGLKFFEVIKEIEKNISIEVECVDTKSDFEVWLNLQPEVIHAFLLNAKRFIRTKFVQQGATVFIEISTDSYWYLDNRHKNHFEVFNSIGEHIWEANLDGSTRLESKKPGRTIDI